MGAGDRTALRELVERDLGQDVCAWMRQRRKADPTLGVRRLSKELHTLTGRQVSYVTLLRWCDPDWPPE